MASSLTGLLYSLYDGLMLLAPAGWASVDLEFAQVRGALRLTQLSTRGEGAKAPKPKPNLFIEPRAEAERLSDAVTELAATVAQSGKAWGPGVLRVERTPEFSEVKMLRPDGSTLWFSRLKRADLETLLMTDELFDALSGTERAFHDLQQRLEPRLGVAIGFDFDAATSELTVQRDGDSVKVPVQVVGHYEPQSFNWVWSWADESANPETCAAVRRVCSPDLQPPGLAALWRPHFHCDEGFAWALASHAAVSIGARGLFRAELTDGQGAVFFAVMRDP